MDLLNAGEGFSDIFEEEINMGEYAGESAVMCQCVLNLYFVLFATVGNMISVCAVFGVKLPCKMYLNKCLATQWY